MTSQDPPRAEQTAPTQPLARATASSPAATTFRKTPEQPEELGDVRWLRGFEKARTEANTQKRPLLVLFDEVPGCSTVRSYGERVLRHPLIVEAAESLFVPVAVYNNVEGDDKTVLESFGEPSWNNPVVRIIDPERNALAPRVAGDYSVSGLATAMATALHKQNRAVPPWLALLSEESAAQKSGTQKATFAMYCFWSGEAHLGRPEGVVATRTGFLDGHEVVEVEFDPQRISYEDLVKHARKGKSADRVYARSDAQLTTAKNIVGSAASRNSKPIRPSYKDDRYRLRHTHWRYVPMTPAQATRANAALAAGRDPSSFFSPQQRAMFKLAAQNPKAGWPQELGRGDFRKTYHKARTIAQKL